MKSGDPYLAFGRRSFNSLSVTSRYPNTDFRQSGHCTENYTKKNPQQCDWYYVMWYVILYDLSE